MREILFRAKQHYTKEWLYGAVVKDGDECLITVGEPDGLYKQKMTVVEESTVGQFTGLNDRNGKRIFEGDIVKYKDGMHHWSGAYETPTLVEYECGGFYPFAGEGEYAMSSEYAIVIGNIHDNPELLEAKS